MVGIGRVYCVLFIVPVVECCRGECCSFGGQLVRGSLYRRDSNDPLGMDRFLVGPPRRSNIVSRFLGLVLPAVCRIRHSGGGVPVPGRFFVGVAPGIRDNDFFRKLIFRNLGRVGGFRGSFLFGSFLRLDDTVFLIGLRVN